MILGGTEGVHVLLHSLLLHQLWYRSRFSRTHDGPVADVSVPHNALPSHCSSFVVVGGCLAVDMIRFFYHTVPDNNNLC